LEERIVDNFDFDSKMKAKSVKQATTYDIRRIAIDLVIIVLGDFRINVLLEELFSLFGFDEQKIEEIYKVFFEILQQLPMNQFLLAHNFMKRPEKVSLASTCNHLRL
jgi:hypothetical protein